MTCTRKFLVRRRLHTFLSRNLMILGLVMLVVGPACGGDDGGNPLVAEAGPNVHVFVGEAVTLDGRASRGPEGASLHYTWTLESAPSASTARIQNWDQDVASFVPDVAGRYEVRLVVSDGSSESDPDTLVVSASDAQSSVGWSAIFGGEGDEEMEGLVATPDGGFLVCGLTDTYSADEDADALLVKLDGQGNVVWAKTYGGKGDDMAVDAHAVPGGFVVAGWTQSFGVEETDIWLLRIDEEGNLIWARSYGGSGHEQAWSVDISSDGGIILAGGTTSFGAGGADYLVVKLNGDGLVEWARAYGGPQDDAPGDPYDEYVARARVDGSGKIVVSSVSYSFGTAGDIWTLRLEPSDGSILWQFAYGGPDEDSSWSFSVMTDGGYLFSGSFVDGATSEADLWAFKVADDGAVVWQRTYGVPGKFDEALNQLVTSDGGALVAAYYENVPETDWRATVLKLAADGSLEWAKEYQNGDVSWTNALVELSDGYAALGVAAADASVWNENMWVWRMDLSGTVSHDCPLGVDLQLTQRDTTVVPAATNATITDTAPTVRDTDVVVTDVVLSPDLECW